MEKVLDVYNLHIQKIKKEIKKGRDFSVVINEEWNLGISLFKFIKYSGGCLTMIKASHAVSDSTSTFYIRHKDGIINEKLTTELLEDENIPSKPIYIKPEHLEHFAKWQRRLDNIG